VPDLTPDVIAGFSGSVLSQRYDNPQPTPEFHREVWEMCCSQARCVAIAAPRGSAKSTCVTFAYVLSEVLFRGSQFVVIGSKTEGQSVDFLNEIKAALLENTDLRELFGVKRFLKDRETDIVVMMSDKHQFRIVAKGSEQELRGMKWRGKRPDLFVGDDMEGDEQVLNQDRREKFSNWVYGAVLPMMSDYGKIRFIGTILHMASFLEKHMPDEKDPECVKTEISTKLCKEGEMWWSAKFKAHNSDYTKLLWPEKLSELKLRMLRKDYTDRGFPAVYAREYLNVPIDESTAFFRREDFVESANPGRLRYYAAVDFAISQKERADYTVIAVCGIDLDNRMHVVDVRRGRWDALQIIEEMFSVQKRYEPELFTVESGVIEKAIGPFMKAEMYKRNMFLNLNPLVPTKDKQSRARSLQARMRAGGVSFDKTADWFPDCQSEMLRFPKDEHDDQVDALAWIGLTLDQVMIPQTDKELEDERFEEFENELPIGRSVLTGY